MSKLNFGPNLHFQPLAILVKSSILPTALVPENNGDNCCLIVTTDLKINKVWQRALGGKVG